MLWLAITIALCFVAGAAIWLLRLPTPPLRRLPQNPYATRYPIVLAHGLLGFDSIGLSGRRLDYFRGVPDRLRELGVDLVVPNVAPLASITERAKQLKEQIDKLRARRVTIVAHSMGGLDARCAITELGLGRKVAALITIGCPHAGTPLADISAGALGERLGVRQLVESVGVDVGALYDLTTRRLTEFNQRVTNAFGVDYACYLASVSGITSVHPLLVPTYLYLSQTIGDNDGLVPVESQRWGLVLGRIEADHWSQIGWSLRFDAAAFYAEMMRELRANGW